MPGIRATFALILLALCTLQVEAAWYSSQAEKTDSSPLTESAVQKPPLKVSEQTVNDVLGRKGVLAGKSWAREEENLNPEEEDIWGAYDEEVGNEKEQQQKDAGWLGFLGLGSKSGATKEAPLTEADGGLLEPSVKPNFTKSTTAGILDRLSKPQLLGERSPLNRSETKDSKSGNWFTQASAVSEAAAESGTEEAVAEGLVDEESQRRLEGGLADKSSTPKKIGGWFTRPSTTSEEDEARQTQEDETDEQTQGRLEAGLADKSLTSKKVGGWFTRPSTTADEDEARQTEEDETAEGLFDEDSHGMSATELVQKPVIPKKVGSWFGRTSATPEEDEERQTGVSESDEGPLDKQTRRGLEPGLANKPLTSNKVGGWFAKSSTTSEEREAIQLEESETDEGLVNNPEDLLEAELAANASDTAYGEQPPKGWRGWGLFAGKKDMDNESEDALDVPPHKAAVAEALARPDRVQGTLPETEGPLNFPKKIGDDSEEGQALTEVQTPHNVRGSVPATWGRLTAPKEEEIRVEDEGEQVQKPIGLRATIPAREGPVFLPKENAEGLEDERESVQKPQRAWGPLVDREGPSTAVEKEGNGVEEAGESLLEVQKAASAKNITTAALRAAVLQAIGQVTNGSALTDTEAAKKLIFELFGTGREIKNGATSSLNADSGTGLDNDTAPLRARNDSANFSQTLYQMGVYKTSIGLQNALLRPINTSNSTADTPKKETSIWGSLFGGAGEDETEETTEGDSREALPYIKPKMSEGIIGSNDSMQGVLQGVLQGDVSESEELLPEEAIGLTDSRLEKETAAGEMATSMLQNVADQESAGSDTEGEVLPVGNAELTIVENELASEGPQLLDAQSASSGVNLTTLETPEEESDQVPKEGSETLAVKSLVGSTLPESDPETGEKESDSGYEWDDYEDESDKEEAAFFENLFNPQTLGAVHEKAKAHLVPQVQALSQATTDAYDSTHKQLKASLDGVVGPKASGFTASLIVMLLLLVPGTAVVFICHRLKAVFSLQTSLFVCASYLTLYSLVLSLIALVYKEPLSVFQRSYPGAYVMFQFLSLLAYVIFLTLCATSCWAALKTREPLQQALGVGQLLPALAIGVHYFGTVWQPAMLDKVPHVKWTTYAVYTIAASMICLMTWFRRSRHEVLASGGSVYKQL